MLSVQEIINTRLEKYNNMVEKLLADELHNLCALTNLSLEELKPELREIVKEPVRYFFYRDTLLLSVKTLKAFYD